MKIRKLSSFLVATAFLIDASSASACSRILWNDNDLGVFVSRTMDWPESTEPVLTVLPRGQERNGGLLGDTMIVEDNPARWTSKFGSLVTTVYGIGAVDGVNEAGLAAHLLYLNATDLPARDPSVPGLHIGLWAQYVLDNAATVEEALARLEEVQLVMADVRGHKGTLHLVIEDAGGTTHKPG